MSQLLPLLAKLKESGAERVFFAPNEQGYALDGDAKRPVPGGPVRGATILEAISELLSQDDIHGLSANRPRIVRHEHDGEDFVLEIVRQSNGIALGIRQAPKTPRLRDSVRRDEPKIRDSFRKDEPTAAWDSVRREEPEGAAHRDARREDARPEPRRVDVAPGKSTRQSRRMRSSSAHRPAATAGDKRTVRAILDDDGNLVDPQNAIAVEIDRVKGSGFKEPTGGARQRVDIRLPEERNDTKPAVKRPDPAVDMVQATRDTPPDGGARAMEAAREAAREVAREAAREVAREAAREAAQEIMRDVVARGPSHEPVARRDPPEPARSGPAKIDGLLRDMLQRKASDLHLTADNHPVFRVDGEMHFAEDQRLLTSKDILEMVREVMTEKARHEFETLHDADFAYEIPGLARFRVNVFEDRHGTGAVLRQIPIKILTAEQLGLPKACLDLCWLSKGLVLVTGPTGSGKSTTLAAMIDFINKNRSDHIITIEDPVEFIHHNQKCLVNQREVGHHTKSFKNALRAALREDPDIVLVGEMRDLETISIAIETAETGHLVFGTLHTTTAISTVDRIIDQFPADRQEQIRVMLSESLKGVVAQILCPKIGGGRVAAHEILLGTTAVGAMIREGKTFQITSIMQTQKGQGMVTMNDSLFSLVQKKLVDPKQAYVKAVDKSGFAQMLKAAGISAPI